MLHFYEQQTSEKNHELIRETKKLNRIIKEQGTDQAFADIANHFYDKEDVMLVMDRLHLPKTINRKKETASLIKKNQANRALREIEISILQDYIKEQKLSDALTRLANGFHDEKNVMFIMDRLRLSKSIDRKKENVSLIKKNQTLQEQAIKKLNEKIKNIIFSIDTKENVLLTSKVEEERILNKFRSIAPRGFSDAKSLSFIIDKLDFPTWITREKIKEFLIRNNQNFLTKHKLTPMIHSLCDKQALDKVFQQVSLPENLEKEIREWAIKKSWENHYSVIEPHLKKLKEESSKQPVESIEEKTQNYIK